MKKGKICLLMSIIIIATLILDIFFTIPYNIHGIINFIACCLAFIYSIICIVELKKKKEKIQNDFIIIAIGTLINVICSICFGSFFSFGILLVLIGIPGLITFDKV